MNTNSAFSIQQQEIMKILGNSAIDIDQEMDKLFSQNEDPNRQEVKEMVLCGFGRFKWVQVWIFWSW